MFAAKGSPVETASGSPAETGSGPLAEAIRPRVVAIGGIAPDNIRKALKMGFSGVAALGIIWQEPDKSLWQYRNLRAAWKKETRRNNYA